MMDIYEERDEFGDKYSWRRKRKSFLKTCDKMHVPKLTIRHI